MPHLPVTCIDSHTVPPHLSTQVTCASISYHRCAASKVSTVVYALVLVAVTSTYSKRSPWAKSPTARHKHRSLTSRHKLARYAPQHILTNAAANPVRWVVLSVVRAEASVAIRRRQCCANPPQTRRVMSVRRSRQRHQSFSIHPCTIDANSHKTCA